MARQISRVSSAYQSYGCFVVHGTGRKEAWICDEFHPRGVLADVTPAPGRTYIRSTWPPRGRGRGESLYSPRRVESKFRALEVLRLRMAGYTWQTIAKYTGFKDASGPWRAVNRAVTRIEHDRRRACH